MTLLHQDGVVFLQLQNLVGSISPPINPIYHPAIHHTRLKMVSIEEYGKKDQ